MQWRRNLWILSLATFIGNISFTVTMPFMPAYLKELGVQDNLPFWSGLMISVTFLTYALMAPIWGSLADRHGKRVMLLRSGIGIALTLVLQASVINHWQFLACRTFNGLLSGFIPAAIMLVASNTPGENMGYALGIINTFTAMGSIMGPSLGGVLLQFVSIRQVMLIAAALLVVASVVAYYGSKEKVIKQTVKTTISQDFRLIMGNRFLQVYFLAMIVLQMSTFVIQPILPLYLEEMLSTNVELVTGMIFSVSGISLAIGSPLICKIKRVSYYMLLLYGLVLSGLLSVLQGFALSAAVLGLERFFYGFANAAVNVSGNVLITQCTGEEMRGRVFGTLNGLAAIGSVIGPLMGGLLGESLGNASAFHGSAFLFFVAAAAAWSIRNKQMAALKVGLNETHKAC